MGFKLAGGKGLREGWDSKELWKSVEKAKPKEINSPQLTLKVNTPEGRTGKEEGRRVQNLPGSMYYQH